ncbi:SIS domain-containing protein [Rossellomorea vietnamensis]|uniref:UPF0309 protein FZC84_03760 n=1 Tax=Rossellomorea vietnamensis TaxID=218284 RepID=A0A5D4MG37_9BACI|nr:SIS domain-containing protein [Rossellomorea vietnamensis]TYS00622.1 SIS domain-containing protein [Rossellomorea vietnamensis]
MFKQYFKKLEELLNVVEIAEHENIKKAAEEIARSIQQGGIIHVFGCGHSHILGEELFYRAGGLVPISPLLIEDLMLHKGAVRSSQLEKEEGLAEQFMAGVEIEPEDVMIVASTSGRNHVPVDVAEIARRTGAFVIAVTSPRYAVSQPSRHSSGRFLYQSVDLVIDNHIEIGDALMSTEKLDVPFGTGSTIIGAAIVNGMMVEAVDLMVKNGFTPPIFKSGNVDGAEEHNRILINKYKSRIPMLER